MRVSEGADHSQHKLVPHQLWNLLYHGRLLLVWSWLRLLRLDEEFLEALVQLVP